MHSYHGVLMYSFKRKLKQSCVNFLKTFINPFYSSIVHTGQTQESYMLLAYMDRNMSYPAMLVPICNPERLGYFQGWNMKVMNSRLALAI